jgi:starvation-inducible outer membrane lipoprotein
MIKRVALPAALLFAIAFLISACASPDELMTEETSSRSAAPVPGERLPDEGTVAPPAPGSSAGVRW